MTPLEAIKYAYGLRLDVFDRTIYGYASVYTMYYRPLRTQAYVTFSWEPA